MAITIGQLQAITHDLILNSLTDNVYQSAAGFRFFYGKREKHDGGLVISAPVITGSIDNTTGGWYAGSEDLAGAEKDDISRASVDWKQVQETVFISMADINKNGGGNGVLKLLASKVKIAEKRMKSRLASGVFNDGSVANQFGGLQLIVGSSAYGGLDSGDILDESGASAWLAYQKTSAGTLTEPLMQLAFSRACEDSDKPDAAFMRQNTFNEVWGLLSSHQRIIVDDASFSGAGHDAKTVLMYNGIPHHIDSHMKAASIYYINSEYTKLHVHSAEDLKAQSFKQLEDNNAVKERMLLMGNMFCVNRRANSSVEGITVVA